MLSNQEKPFVSVIVPVYNGELVIEKNIQALIHQDYPKDSYEIIIVDNGSTDTTRKQVANYPVQLLEESIKRGSYAARNRGIVNAKGTIIAFTDADAVPESHWLSQGVACLAQENVDMVGGNIIFTFSEKPTIAELVDSLINLDNKTSIKNYGIAKTANFFVYKKIFNEIGLFNDMLLSGGDGVWTARAKKLGKKIEYAALAKVTHPARDFSELIKKHIRVGSGSIAVWRACGKKWWWIIAALIYSITPFFILRIPGFVEKKRIHGQHYPIVQIMMIAYICKLVTVWGIIKHFLRRTIARIFSRKF